MSENPARKHFLKTSGLLGLQSCEGLFKPGPYLVFEQLDSGYASTEEALIQDAVPHSNSMGLSLT